MTLEDLGNIGEFVGSIGVIASLIYLVVQNLIDHHSSLQMQMISTPDLNEALRMVADDPDNATQIQTRWSFSTSTYGVSLAPGISKIGGTT